MINNVFVEFYLVLHVEHGELRSGKSTLDGADELLSFLDHEQGLNAIVQNDCQYIQVQVPENVFFSDRNSLVSLIDSLLCILEKYFVIKDCRVHGEAVAPFIEIEQRMRETFCNAS